MDPDFDATSFDVHWTDNATLRKIVVSSKNKFLYFFDVVAWDYSQLNFWRFDLQNFLRSVNLFLPDAEVLMKVAFLFDYYQPYGWDLVVVT